jgi:Putative adhesin
MLLVLALAASVPFAYDGRLNPGQTLTIRNLNGGVRVRTGDRLSIHATKHAERGDPNAVQIHVETRSDGLVVCTRYPPNASRGCYEADAWEGNHDDNDTVVDFEVTLPRGVTLHAATVNGSIDAATDGPIDARAVNGSVHAEGADVRDAASVNGSVTVKILGRGRGTLDAKTVNGSIDVSLPSGTGFDLHAKTVSGSITAPGVTVARPRYGPGARADGTTGDGARRIDAKSVSGSITIHA